MTADTALSDRQNGYPAPLITPITEKIANPGGCESSRPDYCSFRLFIFLRLEIEYLGVLSVLPHQFVVGTAFDETPLFKHVDAVRHTGRGKTV